MHFVLTVSSPLHNTLQMKNSMIDMYTSAINSKMQKNLSQMSEENTLNRPLVKKEVGHKVQTTALQ